MRLLRAGRIVIVHPGVRKCAVQALLCTHRMIALRATCDGRKAAV